MNEVALLFLATVFGVARAFLVAVRRIAPQWVLYSILCLASWLAISGVLGANGMLGGFDSRPPHFLVFIAVTLAVTLWLALGPVGARFRDSLGWGGLIGFQVFRVPVEWVLFELAHAGVTPAQMTFEGWNFDVLTGVTAPLVAWLAATGRIGERALALWNAVGLALLANVVAIAILSAPTPLRVFMNDPANTFVADWPWCWLPGFLVPAALFGHLVAFRKLGLIR